VDLPTRASCVLLHSRAFGGDGDLALGLQKKKKQSSRAGTGWHGISTRPFKIAFTRLSSLGFRLSFCNVGMAHGHLCRSCATRRSSSSNRGNGLLHLSLTLLKLWWSWKMASDIPNRTSFKKSRPRTSSRLAPTIARATLMTLRARFFAEDSRLSFLCCRRQACVHLRSAGFLRW
jgi:hypothetical protein